MEAGSTADPARTRAQKSRAALTLGLLAGFAFTVFAALWLLDYFVLGAGNHLKGPASQLFDFDAETMQNALGSLAQVIAAVLGIAITVVSIVVQLAANRYTSRVTDMFFRDRTNLAVTSFICPRDIIEFDSRRFTCLFLISSVFRSFSSEAVSRRVKSAACFSMSI